MEPATAVTLASSSGRLGASAWLIWAFALGYFAFYTPYAALTKALSSGLLPALQAPPRLAVLSVSLLATTALVAALFTARGWWRYAARRELCGLEVPAPGLHTALAGLGTALIVTTTTIAYTFVGVSIMLALVLMRGGVLLLAPVIDLGFNRYIRWESWAALALALLAVVVALREVAQAVPSATGMLWNLLAYLLGYCLRLPTMTRIAKQPSRKATLRYLAEEQVVSLPLLAALAVVLWLGASNDPLQLQWPALAASFLIGGLYAALFLCGSFIYLDHRENTFCVPVNRSVSLLAGVAATALLVELAGHRPVQASEWLGASLVLIALCILGRRTREDSAVIRAAP